MIPGINVLSIALTVLAKHTPRYFQDIGRTQTPEGNWVTTFAPGVDVSGGQIQPVPQGRYENLGLDLKRTYVTWFVSKSVIGIARGISGDEIEWNGRRYKLQSETDWVAQDGWTYVICVDIGPATND